MKKRTWMLVGVWVICLLPMSSAVARGSSVKFVHDLAQMTVAKSSPVTDEQVIEQVVTKKIGIELKLKSFQTRIVDDWATTIFSLDFFGQLKRYESHFLLRKSNGQWQIVKEYYKPLDAKTVREIGLPPTTAKKLGVPLSADKTVTANHTVDEQAIRRAIYKLCHATESGIVFQGKPEEAKVKYEPIRYAGSWAATAIIFYTIKHSKGDDGGYENDSTLLFKKSVGRWSKVAEYYGGAMKPTKAKSIALPAAVAKQLDITITSTAD